MTEARAAATLVLLVHDRPGALAKIANVFYRRGLDIRALTVAPATVAEHARLEIAVSGPCGDWPRLGLALDNLVDVVAVEVRPPAQPLSPP